MDMTYTFNEEDLASSVPGTPRSGLRTPPTSPLWSTGSAITTPGSSGTTEYSHWQAEVFQPGSLTQAKRYHNNKAFQGNDGKPSGIEEKRYAFFASIRETVLPLLGADHSPERLFEIEESSHAQVTDYVLLDSQPTGIRATLKSYQLEGLSKMIYWRNNGIGGILADDMGLGKTLQALSLFQYVKDNERADSKFLVVCPLSVLNTWMSEISRWTTGLRPMAYHGGSEERENLRTCFRQQGAEPWNIVVTTYETLCSDLWFFQKTLWAHVVLDEGHRIKNSRSKRTQGVYRLRSENRIVLTGTPIQNDLTELWSILHWLYPDVFVPATAKLFENAFSLTDGKFDSIFLSHITRFLKVVMLRRTKCDSQIGLDLPPKKETVFSVPLTELQLGWYRTILTGVDESILLGSIEQEKSQSNVVPMTDSIVESMTAAWETNKATNTKRRSHITTNTLMELRKCSIHPYLLADALPKEYNIGQHIVDASCKFIVLQKMIRQYVGLENKKVIIFSGFDQTLDLCEDLLEMEKAQFSFKYGRLDGSTSSAWRNLSVFLFQNDPRYMVFLLSTRAGGEGLNLVSSSIVIFLDDDWNPQVMRQAESRVHRIGQTQPVQIFRIHAKGTVEDQMRRRMDKKAYLADKVMGEFGNNITHHTDLEETTEDEICLIPSRPIIPRSFDAKDLVNSDFHSIMSSYALDEVSIQGMSHAEKRAWLARSERVKTNIFNGVMVETKYRRFSVYDETVLSISKASRRIGKSRVVTVGEWKVSKESMEMATPVSPTFPKQGVGDKACKMNEAACFSCHGQKPIKCETCPRSFHLQCLDAEDMDYSFRGRRIICPHHYCCSCGKTASAAGRLLFSCLKCPRAYCENCLHWGRTNFIGENPAAEALGYVPKNAFFIKCAGCEISVFTSVEKHPFRLEGLQPDLDSPKRVKRC